VNSFALLIDEASAPFPYKYLMIPSTQLTSEKGFVKELTEPLLTSQKSREKKCMKRGGKILNHSIIKV
jgi:hypothetical protein